MRVPSCRQVSAKAGDLGLGALDDRRVGQAPMGGHRLAGPDRTDLAGGVVTDGEDEIERGAPGAANSSQDFERKAGQAQSLAAQGVRMTSPFGGEPAEKARKRPAPSLFINASARIERAELPVHRKSTL